ncbi:Dual specificity protein phosphatase 1-B [Halotydeus destructor]|nr:Dual specificity protein phosphatase 1-B [Halotydeus destructor]
MKSHRRSPPLSVVVTDRRDSTDSGRLDSGAGALLSLGASSDPVEILPHLYLGSESHASSQDTLERLGITALLNVSHTCPNHFEQLFTYKSIPVEDTCLENISAHFHEAIDFIEKIEKNGGKVLVHCHAGISRSATICIAYIMSTRKLRMEEAYEFVKSRRTVVSPNFNFMEQLLTFEGQVFPVGAGCLDETRVTALTMAETVAGTAHPSAVGGPVSGADTGLASSPGLVGFAPSTSSAHSPRTADLGSQRSSIEAGSSGYGSSPDTRLRLPRDVFDFTGARSSHQKSLISSLATSPLPGPQPPTGKSPGSGETSPIKSGSSPPIMSPT